METSRQEVVVMRWTFAQYLGTGHYSRFNPKEVFSRDPKELENIPNYAYGVWYFDVKVVIDSDGDVLSNELVNPSGIYYFEGNLLKTRKGDHIRDRNGEVHPFDSERDKNLKLQAA